MARFKPSNKVMIMTIGAVAGAFLAAIFVGILIKGFKEKTRITSASVAAERQKEIYGKDAPAKDIKPEQAGEGQPDGRPGSTVEDAISKEKAAIMKSDKGGFVGAVSVKSDKNASAQDVYDPTAPVVETNAPDIITGQTHMPRGSEGKDKKSDLYAYLYGKRGSGGFVAAKAAAKEGRELEKAPDMTDGKSASQQTRFPVQVEYYRPYKAIVDRTFDSAGQNASFVGVMSDPLLKGWKAVGKTMPNYDALRFQVEITSVLSPDSKPYPMKGFVTSIDMSDGIVSAVRHDDVKSMAVANIMKGASSFLDAFRSDTTTIEVTSGATVTGQTKVADRGKEAGLAAGSSMFDDLNRKVTDRGKKRPTIIVEKGVPVYIYFTP